MKHEWTLLELLGRFPAIHPESQTILRCVRAARSGGRVDLSTDETGWAEVDLVAWPAQEFSLRCLHRWPASVAQDEADPLDEALLRGLLRGCEAVEHPPWSAAFVCEGVGYRAGVTTPESVEAGAQRAMEIVVSHGQWVVDRAIPQESA